jgi:hypothetical protein
MNQNNTKWNTFCPSNYFIDDIKFFTVFDKNLFCEDRDYTMHKDFYFIEKYILE